MIARITGRLESVADGSALIDAGSGLCYEVLVPACDVERMSRRVGQDVRLHTIHFLEGDLSHGQAAPRLVGFGDETDREFFRLFTTVKGIGIRKALRAMARPAGEIASAIASQDAKFLVALPEIGKRTAQQIIAELSDKVGDFAVATSAAGSTEASELTEAAREAIMVLTQLGEKHAPELVDRVLAVAPDVETPEEIIQHVYKLKAGSSS